jgi:hypothetical protein
MAKRFSQIARGHAQVELTTATTIDGIVVEFALRPMPSGVDGDVLDAAHAETVKRNATPKDGEPIYDYWMGVYTLLHAAVDPESDPKKPALFFDGGVEDIRSAFSREQIAALLQKQRVLQQKCDPRPSKMGPGEFMAWVMKEAVAEEGEEDPTERWHPWLRTSSVRTLASLYMSLLRDKSLSSSDSPSQAASSPTPSEVAAATSVPAAEQEAARVEVGDLAPAAVQAILDDDALNSLKDGP